jgi:hypothetical protein
MVRLGRFFPTAILRVLVLAFYAVVAFAARVEAITIESGFLNAGVVSDFEEHFVLNGPEFSISGGGGGYHFAMLSLPHIGSPTDLGGTTEVTSNHNVCVSCGGLPFEVQLKGVTFSEPGFKYSGQFNFSSVIPSTQPDLAGLDSAPFGFTGSLTGVDAATNQEVFSLSLNGGGIATAFFMLESPPDRLDMRSVRFDFAPIPEPPATLLVATGLLGLATYRWRAKGLQRRA